MKYKKFFALLFTACLVMILLVGCTSGTDNQQSTIGPAELTRDQQGIVDLISRHSGQEFLIFDFQTVDTYKKVEFWLEVYEYGVSVDRPAGLTMVCDEGSLFKGQLVILINHYHDGASSWRFTIINKEGGSASSIGWSQTVNNDVIIGRGFGPIDEPIIIQEGAEFILYYSRSTLDVLRTYDHQIFLEQPRLLERYPYAHIIKGRFSN